MLTIPVVVSILGTEPPLIGLAGVVTAYRGTAPHPVLTPAR